MARHVTRPVSVTNSRPRLRAGESRAGQGRAERNRAQGRAGGQGRGGEGRAGAHLLLIQLDVRIVLRVVFSALVCVDLLLFTRVWLRLWSRHQRFSLNPESAGRPDVSGEKGDHVLQALDRRSNPCCWDLRPRPATHPMCCRICSSRVGFTYSASIPVHHEGEQMVALVRWCQPKSAVRQRAACHPPH